MRILTAAALTLAYAVCGWAGTAGASEASPAASAATAIGTTTGTAPAAPSSFILQPSSFPQRLLSKGHSAAALRKILVPRDRWRPFPPVADRKAWARADAEILAACVAEGERLLDYKWPPLPATLSLAIARTGNRSDFDRLNTEKRRALTHLVLAEIAENRGRFTDAIVNGVWSICEESWWGSPAHLSRGPEYRGLHDITRPRVDLFTATTAETLAWTDYFLGEKLDAVSPVVRRRIRHEVNRRLLEPVLAHHHWWMGEKGGAEAPNNWNPWICSNWLACALLLAPDEDARARHAAAVLETLDNFLDHYPDDGGCDEGPGYWNAAAGSLYDNLALLDLATAGATRPLLRAPKIRNMAAFVWRAQISEKYSLNFADASPHLGLDAPLVWRFGAAAGDTAMRRFAAFYLPDKHAHPLANLFNRTHFARAFFYLFERAAMDAEPKSLPLPRDVWLPGIQVMLARDTAGSARGWTLAAKGGHNDESHNHNDVGNFILYRDGAPVIVDVGSGKYTAKTFSADRYTIWNLRSEYHNTPAPSGVGQSAGAAFRARDARHTAGDRSATLSLDITAAYPPAAGLRRLRRTITLERGTGANIRDEYELAAGGGAVFAEHIMVCHPARITGDAEVTLDIRNPAGNGSGAGSPAAPVVIRLRGAPAGAVTVRIEPIVLSGESDTGVRNNWGDGTLRRITFLVNTAGAAGAAAAAGALTLEIR
ncbi:MAG: heparinase II/III-family protein [Puniceicoccales bacterium]|jgi:hypothetical protein|nr:heparinase II/III-family protein [Puniceicoccales bacterium]